MLDEHRGDLGVFDQIICLETIEHVTADEELVTALATMLEAGGRLLLSTPFDGHRPLYLEERNPTPVEDGFHVRYGYSPRRLRQLAENAGLEVASEAFISGVVSQKLINVMRRLTRRIGFAGAWLLVLPLRTLVVFDVPLTRLLRYPYLSVALVGVKRG
jgi:hypothetical protein